MFGSFVPTADMAVLSGKSGRETRRAVGLSIHLWADRLKNRARSAVREFVVLRDRPLQVVVFIAGDETDLLESGEMLFGFRLITLSQIGFTEVFVRAAMSD
jgi:hypothetical protein